MKQNLEIILRKENNPIHIVVGGTVFILSVDQDNSLVVQKLCDGHDNITVFKKGFYGEDYKI